MNKTLSKQILKNKIAYLFIFPSFLAYIVFLVYPLIRTLIMSLSKYEVRSFTFIGISNYIKLFSDEIFKKAIFNTFLLVIFTVPVVLGLSILIASFIMKKSHRLRSFAMGIFYLPSVTSIVTICIAWKWIYSARNGIFNEFLNLFGIADVNWLGNAVTALPVIITVMAYNMVGSPIILYSAAMGAIPKSYYELADIEGATNFQKLWNITIPLIKPTTLYLTIVLTIGLFQTFVIIKLITGGGPYYATTTISFHLIQMAFLFSKYGIASAIGVVLLVLVAGLTITQFTLLSSEVEY